VRGKRSYRLRESARTIAETAALQQMGAGGTSLFALKAVPGLPIRPPHGIFLVRG